jgi:hypothetical protein
MTRCFVQALLSFVLLVGASLASAQQPTGDEEKRKEMAVRVMQQVGYDKLYDSMADQMTPTLTRLTDKLLQGGGVSEDKRKDIVAHLTVNFLAEFKSAQVRKLFTDEAVSALTTEYTLEELEALSTFYATPLAQKMIARQPVLMQRLVQRGTQIGEQVGRRAAELTIEQMNLPRR